jgi:hypothetical protein
MPKTKKKTSKRKPNPAFMRPVQPVVRVSVQDFTHIDQHLSAFNDETSNAEFLFDTDAVNCLEQIRQRAQNGDAIWLSDPDRITATTKTFAPYLRFSSVKI